MVSVLVSVPLHLFYCPNRYPSVACSMRSAIEWGILRAIEMLKVDR